MPLQRTQHWATRSYHRFLLDRAHAPFAWGKNDCALFSADAVQSITGVDIAAEFRGKYADKDSALALIKRICNGSTVADAAAHCAARHGLAEHKSPLLAKRGDLVIVNDGGNPISGVIHLNGRHVVVMAEAGWKLTSIQNVKRAWAI